MEQLMPGFQSDLGKRLSQLSRALQQVAAKQPAAGAAVAEAGPDGAAADAAAAPTEQDAALQRALCEAAERIRDFQRRAEHEAQQLQLEAALAPIRAAHNEETARLGAQVVALKQRVAELEAEHSAAISDGAAWQQRATITQDHLDASLRKHEAAAGELQGQLAAAEARGQELAAGLQAAQAAVAAEADALRQQLAAQQALAARTVGELASAAAAWQQEKAVLVSEHAAHESQWAAELELAHMQAANAQRQAMAHTARADAAEQEASGLHARVQQLAGELGAAREAQRSMESALEEAVRQGGDLDGRLQAAEAAAAAARRHAEELQQQLGAANKRVKEQAAQLATAQEQLSQDMKRMEIELSDARAEHASTRCALYAFKQQAAEQERLRTAAEARQKQLQEEVAIQKQQASVASTQLGQLNAELLAATKAAAAQQAAAAAAAAELRSQLADALQAAELALQEVAEARVGCESQVELLQQTQTQQLAAAAAEAAALLAQREEAAAAALAAREAALLQQLEQAAAAAEQEQRQLCAQHAAAAAAEAGQWEALCAQLAAKLCQLGANLGADPQAVQLSIDDTLLVPAGPALARHAASPAGDGADEAGGPATDQPSATGPSAPYPPPPMVAVHTSLKQLYSAALDLHWRYGAAKADVAALQEAAEGLRQQAAEERQSWQQRLERELREQAVAWDLKCSEQVATAVAEGRARLAASEDRLQAELTQVTHTLAAAQHDRQGMEQQCSQLAEELLAAQAAAAEGLETAAAHTAAVAQQAKEEAAAAATRAAEQLARTEESARRDMQSALARLGEQQAAALQAAAVQHQQALEEAHLLAEQAARHQEQELKRVEEAWQLRWAGESARLQQQRNDDLAAAAVQHRQGAAELEQRHAAEVARLKEAIATEEQAERQLLKRKAVLEARAAELAAELEAARQQAAADAVAAQAALEAAVAAALTDLQQQVKALQEEKAALVALTVELQQEIGRVPRPADLAAIASLERQLAESQGQLATAEQRLLRMQQELLLREETYNKKFGGGGAAAAMSVGSAAAAPAGLVDWMVKAAGGASSRPASHAATTRLPALGSGGKAGAVSRR